MVTPGLSFQGDLPTENDPGIVYTALFIWLYGTSFCVLREC